MKDVSDEYERLTGTKPIALTCTFNKRTHGWRLVKSNGKAYELPYRAYFGTDLEYACMISNAVQHLLESNEIAGAQPTKTKKTTKKEKKQMKKDSSLAETVYQIRAEAIQDEMKDKKKTLDAEEQEKLAKAYADFERESMLENADKWAEELYARYDALHKKGFAEELAIELLKIYISNH